jgi:dihydroorotase
VAALRAALADGTIDMVITDHAPHTLAEKAAYPDDFPNVPGGMPGLQTLLPAMLSLVASGVIDLKRLAAVCAENPARRFGLGGRKGRIARGYDADIVILDPAGTMSVRNADQHSKAGATPFDGLAVPWRIERVLLTGRKIGERPLGRCVKSAPPLAPIPDGQLVI